MTPPQPMTPTEAETLIAQYFKHEGYHVEMPPPNTKGYDIELYRGEQCIAVQVKAHKAPCNISMIQKFQGFLELPIAAKFTDGWFISFSGFSNPAKAEINREQPQNLGLGTYRVPDAKLLWDYLDPITTPLPPPPPPPLPPKQKYVGVFTSKGGVGKTTVSAHLAGAFALMGYDVVLLDLDPDKNLRKLFLQDLQDHEGDASLYVPPPPHTNQLGASITVLNHDQWDPESDPDTQIIICDCAPELSCNPEDLIKKFDYCIIPTTLNPLGIAKNANVIVRTFRHIRRLNQSVEMFAVINSYITDKTKAKKNEVMLRSLVKALEKFLKQDSLAHFIDPMDVAIRRSDALLYWGYHIFDGSKPQLAFQFNGGISHPRTDFLQLAEYLEYHTDIQALKAAER